MRVRTVLTRAAVTTAAAGAVLLTPGVASAHGVTDPSTVPYCGPGATWSTDESRCVDTHRHAIDEGPTAGQVGVAALGLLGLVFLL